MEQGLKWKKAMLQLSSNRTNKKLQHKLKEFEEFEANYLTCLCQLASLLGLMEETRGCQSHWTVPVHMPQQLRDGSREGKISHD